MQVGNNTAPDLQTLHKCLLNWMKDFTGSKVRKAWWARLERWYLWSVKIISAIKRKLENRVGMVFWNKRPTWKEDNIYLAWLHRLFQKNPTWKQNTKPGLLLKTLCVCWAWGRGWDSGFCYSSAHTALWYLLNDPTGLSDHSEVN